MREGIWIRRLALIGALLALVVVVMGAYTRLTNAGLGCPDWPVCYGHVGPVENGQHYADESAWYKAWVEMRHRGAALLLIIVVAAITVLSLRARRDPQVSLGYAIALLLVIAFQAALGMFTVTLLLTPLIVTAHLLG